MTQLVYKCHNIQGGA